MEFEQWKESMDTDARKKNQELEKEVERLTAENKDLRKRIKNTNLLLQDAETLANRCYVQTGGYLCVFCNLKYFRCKYKTTNKFPDEEGIMALFEAAAKELENTKTD